MVILSGLHEQHYIDDQVFQAAQTILIGLGLAALRHGMGAPKQEKKPSLP